MAGAGTVPQVVHRNKGEYSRFMHGWGRDRPSPRMRQVLRSQSDITESGRPS